MKKLLMVMIVILILAALIFPLSGAKAQPSDTWDKSSLSVTGECAVNLSVFYVTNHGSKMTGYTTWVLYVNDVVTEYGLATWDENEVKEFFFAYEGTLKLIAYQRPGHPGNSVPQASLSGCTEGVVDFTPTPIDTPAPTATPVLIFDTPTALPTDTATSAPSSTSTNTVTPIPTFTGTSTATNTPTNIPVSTSTAIPSAIPTKTTFPTNTPVSPTISSTPTLVKTATSTSTLTPVSTVTVRPTSIGTAVETTIPEDTPTPTSTPTILIKTPTETPIATKVPTNDGETGEPLKIFLPMMSR